MHALLALALLTAAAAPDVNGYLDSRSQFTRARVGGLLPTRDLPQLSELIEANVQLKARYAERGFVYADVSLFGQFVGNYRDVDAQGEEIVIPDHHPPGTDPLVALSELYTSHDFNDELNLLVGKKRLVWGPGFAFNPTDLINPPKDPTDPSFQRAGAYMARVEVTLPQYTFTFLAAPAVTKQTNGIPYRFLTHPSWDERDDEAHYQLAARAYALVADSDVNVMLFYGNKYTEAEPFRDRLRAGASFSRYFFTDYELHAEALFQTGTARTYAAPQCVFDVAGLVSCLQRGTPLSAQPRLNEKTVLPRVLVGARRQFADESMLSIEYLYQADGYRRREFEDFVRLVAVASRLQQANAFGADTTARTDMGTPQKFVFQPVAKHYAFVTFQKPRIKDDFMFSATAIVNAQDLSGMFTPSLSWQAQEWLQLSLFGFVPWPGPRSLSARIPAVESAPLGLSSPEHLVTEYSLLPFEYRVLLQARLFY